MGRGQVVFDEGDVYYERDRPPPRRDEIEVERQEERRGPSREYDDINVRVREREREREETRVPTWMRDERPLEAGPMVLRRREVEEIDRERRRPASPVRERDIRIVTRARSTSPPPRRIDDDVQIARVVERDRIRQPSRPPRERVRLVERGRWPSPSPPPPLRQERVKMVERDRSASRERIKIVRRRSVSSHAPSPAPPLPAPAVVKGPTIERDVITHYLDVDHGVIQARPPSPPPPPPRRPKERDTEIDIDISRRRTEVDIHRHASRSRGPARSPSRERPTPARLVQHDSMIVHPDRDRDRDRDRQRQREREHNVEIDIRDRDRDHGHALHVDIEERHRHRRARSEVRPSIDADDEVAYSTARVDGRGRPGEAKHGITSDWTIVDVPPGTERLRMDGAGGGALETTWGKYSGSRHTKFVERDSHGHAHSHGATPVPESDGRSQSRERRVSVQITDGRETERVTDRRITMREPSPPPVPVPAPRRSDMWTEITKDLVDRDAIEEMAYEYEETDEFFYVMQYLRYEEVMRLVQRSEVMRESRKRRAREIEYEVALREEWSRRHRHRDRDRDRDSRHRHRHSVSMDRYEDGRLVEHELVYEHDHPRRRRYYA